MLVIFVFQVNAQDTYFAEIGVHGGTSYYLGDANNQLFKNPELAYGLIYRQKINQRFAASANWNYTKVTGNSEATGTFENPVHALDFCGEFNFSVTNEKNICLSVKRILLLFLQE